jgi:hypothetical protein
MSEQRLNSYTCRACNLTIVTVDLVEGVTPMMLGCRATKGCRGQMMSSWYHVVPTLTPTHEWFKPASLKGYSREMKQHIRDGGLVLREVQR